MSLDITLYNKKELKCPHCGESIQQDEEYVFDCNITHNLYKMAYEAKIQGATWDANGKKCKEVINELEKGVKDMRKRPEHYKKFDCDNGWGVYTDFMPWLEKLLTAYKEYPNAVIQAFG